LKQKGFEFDIVYTSVLTRAIQTYNIAAENMGTLYLPITRSWRLNERHYGALQGLNKSETAAKHGEDQVKIWRRSYDIPPPPLEETDERFLNFIFLSYKISIDTPRMTPVTRISLRTSSLPLNA